MNDNNELRHISEYIYVLDHNNPYSVPTISTNLLIKYLDTFGIGKYLFAKNITHFLHDMTDEQAHIVFSYIYREYIEKNRIFNMSEVLDLRLITFLLEHDVNGYYVRRKAHHVVTHLGLIECTLLRYLKARHNGYLSQKTRDNLQKVIDALENHQKHHFTLFEIMIDNVDLNNNKKQRF